MKLTEYHKEHEGPYKCEGDVTYPHQPENSYHPSQKAWLMERNLYTGRMIADIGFLPENLKFLTQ